MFVAGERVFLSFVNYCIIPVVKKAFYCVIACISLAILGYMSQKSTRHVRIYSLLWATTEC